MARESHQLVVVTSYILLVLLLVAGALQPGTATRAHPLHDFSPIATVFIPLILRDPAATPAPAYTCALRFLLRPP